MNDQLVQALAGAAITAVITVVAAWLQEIARRRGREQSHRRTLTQFKDEITAIEAWSNTRSSLGIGQEHDEVRTRARLDLDAAYGRFRELLTDTTVERPPALRRALSRLLLLDVPVQGWSRSCRIGYRFFLAMLAVWLGAWASSQKSWTDPIEWMSSATAYFILAITPAWFFGWLTIRLSTRSAARADEAPGARPVVAHRQPQPARTTQAE